MADLSSLVPPPTQMEDVPNYLQRVIPVLISAITELNDMQRTLHVEPPKPREGAIRYADGTNWNPGSGAGLYRFTSGSWVAV